MICKRFQGIRQITEKDVKQPLKALQYKHPLDSLQILGLHTWLGNTLYISLLHLPKTKYRSRLSTNFFYDIYQIVSTHLLLVSLLLFGIDGPISNRPILIREWQEQLKLGSKIIDLAYLMLCLEDRIL